MTDSLQVGQIEVFTIGNIGEQFDRLGITPVTHLKLENTLMGIGVASLTPSDYSKLVNDICVDDSNWQDAGWKNPYGSNLGIPTQTATVNGKEMLCWIDDDLTDEEVEEGLTNDWFVDLFEYLDIGVGATSFKNSSAVIKDLAKYNNMSITEFMLKYVKEQKVVFTRNFEPSPKSVFEALYRAGLN
ncbi:gp126 [Bacillus phage W.Ph.]|uniref:Gp126 n=1 Tax=Bacillus phage W.Ph. TaxID=764595 RepID=G9B1M7_9CAUD|nr:gp126 [Bacillus phage W.Ph.]ADH03272.1 gp126 [Bacillus phage W.Ph.]